MSRTISFLIIANLGMRESISGPALCLAIVLEFEPGYLAGKTCIYNLGQLHKHTNTLSLGIFLLSGSKRYFLLIPEPSVSHAYAGFLLLFGCQR